MLTRKDFILLAEMVNENTKPGARRKAFVKILVRFCAQQNDRFDVSRFTEACNSK